jgi:signal transduction histidine kinase
MRLIITICLTMVVIQLIIFAAVAELFARELRLERTQQMAQMIGFLKPRIEALTDVKVNIALTPQMLFGGQNPSTIDSIRQPTAVSTQAFRLPSASSLPAGFPSVMVVTELPALVSDEEITPLLRESVPELLLVSYRDLGVPRMGPRRAYRMEAWTKLDQNRYLKTVLDDSQTQGEGVFRHGAFPLFDIFMRLTVGVLLALLITSWIVKPLNRLAESADATLPSGEMRPGIAPINIEGAPTEISQTLLAIERMRTRIASMVAERTMMLTALAHDLRTPITRLMLRLALSKDTTLREQAYRDCEAMQSLIGRTLEFIRSNDSSANVTSISINDVLSRLLEAMPMQIRSRIVMTGEAPTVMANTWGVERMFANVIDNAVKYSSPNTPINLKITSNNQWASIEVIDCGRGVASENLAKLKQPFFRVDAARNQDGDDGGAGLGLSIVDNLARTYGGGLEITNRRDGADDISGLIVRIWLPIAK